MIRALKKLWCALIRARGGKHQWKEVGALTYCARCGRKKPKARAARTAT